MSRRGLESTVVARLGTSQPQRTPGNTEEIPSAVLLRDLCGSEFRRPPARRWCPNSALIAKRLGGTLCVWCGRACRRRGTLDCQRLTFAPVPRSKPQSVVEWNHRGIPCVHSVASRSQPEWLPACWGGEHCQKSTLPHKQVKPYSALPPHVPFPHAVSSFVTDAFRSTR